MKIATEVSRHRDRRCLLNNSAFLFCLRVCFDTSTSLGINSVEPQHRSSVIAGGQIKISTLRLIFQKLLHAGYLGSRPFDFLAYFCQVNNSRGKSRCLVQNRIENITDLR
jgi:hypothetical protein